jgi:rubrerythrin
MKAVYFHGNLHTYEDGDPAYDKAIERVDAIVPAFPFASVDELPRRVRVCRFCTSGIATEDATTHCPSCGAPLQA